MQSEVYTIKKKWDGHDRSRTNNNNKKKKKRN